MAIAHALARRGYRSYFRIALAKPIGAASVRASVAESLDRADQRRSLGPRFGFAVGDADHDDLIIGQQRLRFRADRFVEGEDVEVSLGSECESWNASPT